MSTENATKAFIEKKEQEKEERKAKVLEIIKVQPGQTTYSLSRITTIPMSTIRNLVRELDEEFEIKFIEEEENNKLKKKIYIRTVDDFLYTYFNFESIDHPATIRLMKPARTQKVAITFRMPDGFEEILNPNETIEEFKERIESTDKPNCCGNYCCIHCKVCFDDSEE